MTDKDTYFVKYGDDNAGAMFDAEADGLRLLAGTKTVRTPAVIAQGDRWLLLEWLPPGNANSTIWRSFGHALARMHRAQSSQFGGSRSNFIGSLPQHNEWSPSWADFWRAQRLEPQLQCARERGHIGGADSRQFDRLFEVLDERLAIGQQEGASVLHGDLWSGNAHACGDVIAAIDPSAYYGHREVDLAMAALFGGFPTSFWQAYNEEWPLERAELESRRAIYQLYYLLVHVNLFGAGYVAGTRAALQKALS